MNIARILFIFLLFFCSETDMVFGQRIDKSIFLEGRNREYIVSRPSGTAPPSGYPLVFMFHGTSGDGEKFYETSGWKELGEIEKFISVFPSSLAYCVYDPQEKKNILTTKWNNGDLQTFACPGQVFKDDVLFVRSIVDSLKKNFPIDMRRIYACGFSNGATMSAKLATDLSDVFAATVSASGNLHDLDSARISPQIPCWFTVGTMDDRFLFSLQRPYIPYNDSALALLQNTILNFTGSMGLNPVYTHKDSFPKLTFYEFSYTVDQRLTDNKFTFMLAKDMFHVFPNGTNYPVFESAPLYWNYFKNITKSTTTPLGLNAITKDGIRVFPNPASDHLTLNLPFVAGKKITILNAQGKVVQTWIPPGPNATLSLSGISPGVYFLQGRPGMAKFIKL